MDAGQASTVFISLEYRIPPLEEKSALDSSTVMLFRLFGKTKILDDVEKSMVLTFAGMEMLSNAVPENAPEPIGERLALGKGPSPNVFDIRN